MKDNDAKKRLASTTGLEVVVPCGNVRKEGV